MFYDVLKNMKNPSPVDKVARRRSAFAVVIALLALWISICGLPNVIFNFKMFSAALLGCLPIMLVCGLSFFLMTLLPRYFRKITKMEQDTKNHQ